MARLTPLAQGLMPSLLDRIIDPDSLGADATRGYTVAQMRDAVRRDLEDLFNTHTPGVNIPAEYREVHSSVATYGLPDIAWVSSVKGFQGRDLAAIIEQAIHLHEPRLRDVQVVVITEGDKRDGPADKRVHLHIEARLNVDPSPEVEFETVLELTTGQASIREELGSA